jgi:hypothetical protein|tara:strand:+ start:255 stop:437 length:183 start_codon:yes stop_codon:yes gene_type:complete
MNAFFFPLRKKKKMYISFSLSFFLSFADASIINARAGEGEREQRALAMMRTLFTDDWMCL